MFADILKEEFLGNTCQSYLYTLVFFICGFLIVFFTKKIVMERMKNLAKKTAIKFDDFLIEISKKTIVPVLYYGVFYISIINLTLNKSMAKTINVLGTVVLTIYGIKFLLALIIYGFESLYLKKDKSEAKKEGLRGIKTFIKIIIWSIGLIFMMDNLGFEVKTALAGLGISGIALAFASQAVLGDLFSYFAIFFDKPFEIGDFIIVGDLLGVVEKIGIKTTRISSLSGEQLVFSNTDLTNSRIRNYKRMQKRRVVFSFGVLYQTTSKQLKEIPGIVKNIIQNTENTAFDRAHFSSFGASSLDFEVVYYVMGSDYNKYMDIQQAINLDLVEELEKINVEFAYPTQTLHVNMEK